MSRRESIILLSQKGNPNCDAQYQAVDKAKLWSKIKNVYVESKEGKELYEKYGVDFLPSFILRDNTIVRGVIGCNELHDKLDLRSHRGV